MADRLTENSHAKGRHGSPAFRAYQYVVSLRWVFRIIHRLYRRWRQKLLMSRRLSSTSTMPSLTRGS
jgi:hypothetical protein